MNIAHPSRTGAALLLATAFADSSYSPMAEFSTIMCYGLKFHRKGSQGNLAALARARAAKRPVGLKMQDETPTSDETESVTSGDSDADPLLVNTSSHGTKSEPPQRAKWSLFSIRGAHRIQVDVEDAVNELAVAKVADSNVIYPNENKKRLLAYVMLKCFYERFAYSGAYNRELFTETQTAEDYIHELFARIIKKGELSSFLSAKDLKFIWKEAKNLFLEVKRTQHDSSRTMSGFPLADQVSRKISTSSCSEDDKESIAAKVRFALWD